MGEVLACVLVVILIIYGIRAAFTFIKASLESFDQQRPPPDDDDDPNLEDYINHHHL